MYWITLVFVIALLRAVTCVSGCPPYHSNATVPRENYPPDPFRFLSGARVTSKADWDCRRAEIISLLQEIEFGSLPPRPSHVSANFTNNAITISVEENGRKTSFSASIRYPEGQRNGSEALPAIIAYGAASIPLAGTGLAQIIYNSDQIATMSSDSNGRGRGKFYDIYGPSHSAGSIMATVWGVSRLIDGLELLGPEITGISSSYLGITGCSRNSRGALLAGAFEPRIALTISQHVGPGGPACWRMYPEFYNPCRQACIPEQPDPWDVSWYRRGFPGPFRTNFTTMPFDHHELVGLIAPRGLFIIENDIDILQPINSAACSTAGREIYKAVGAADAMGFSIKGSSNLCSFQSSQAPELNAFLDKYLWGKDVQTNVWSSSVDPSRYTRWTWETPILS